MQSGKANCNKMPQIQEEKRGSSYLLLVEFTGGGVLLSDYSLMSQQILHFQFFSRMNVLGIALSS